MSRANSIQLVARVWLPLAVCTLGLLSAGWQTSKPATPGPGDAKPAGKIVTPSAAVKQAFKEAYPNVTLDEIVRPDDFGHGSDDEDPLYWVCRYRVGDQKKDVSVSPDGVLIRKQDEITTKDLPPAVARAVEQAGAAKKLERQETRAGIKYVALAKPETHY